MDEVANKAEDAAAPPPTAAPKRSHHAKVKRFANANARTHGLSTIRQGVNELGRRAIDKRTRTGKALAAWRKELIADMGGDDNVSTQQKTIIDLIVKQKLLLDSVDAWSLTRPLIDRPSKSLIPIVRERQMLADSLARYLGS